MITITTGDGKFFFSDFVNLFEEQSAEIDENALDLKELQYLLSAYNTKRIYINEEDYVKIRDRVALLSTSSSGGGGDIDPALLGLKEDKSNKTTTISGTGSNISYPTTNAVVNYMSGTLTSFKTSLELNTYAKLSDLTSRLSTKVDKTQLMNYPTTIEVDTKIAAVDLSSKADKLVEIPQSALDVPISMGIPLYTLDTGGNYVLCEPDSWVDIENGMCIPAYNKSKLQSI